MVDELERLRLQRILSDWVTGLPLYPVADLRNERVAQPRRHLPAARTVRRHRERLRLGALRPVLRCVTESLRADLETSPLRSAFLSMQFTGCDGFYLLFDLARRQRRGGQAALEKEAAPASATAPSRRLRPAPGPHHRRAHGRALQRGAACPTTRACGPRATSSAACARRRAWWRRARRRSGCSWSRAAAPSWPAASCTRSTSRWSSIQDSDVIGYEALIRGPVGELERPDVLFAVGRGERT